MRAAKQLRLQYGFTQQHLADYLGISKGMLAMYESGKRELPTAALLKLATLQQKTVNSLTPGTRQQFAAHLQKQQARAAKAMEAHAGKCAAAMALAKQQLAAMEKSYSQAVNALELVTRLRQQGNKENRVDFCTLSQASACAN
jgi:predicted transcriptional regulator